MFFYKRNPLVLVFITGLLATGIVVMLFSFGEKQSAVYKPAPPNGCCDTWKAPPFPAEMNFAGEVVPLQQWEVKEQLEREIIINYYMRENIVYLLKQCTRYFPVIEEQLRLNNIPDDFKYLCVAESQLFNAISRSGATGFWQFMKNTAPGYALEVSETVDERYNVEKSTKAACRYLITAYKRFGNWTAAAASYNCGMNGYADRADYQGTNNYYALVLPEETQRYIFRILAFKYLLTHADSLGLALPPSERFVPIKTRKVNVQYNISNLAAFARVNETDYKMLKWLNPWLRGRSLKVKPGKTYEILLPETGK